MELSKKLLLGMVTFGALVLMAAPALAQNGRGGAAAAAAPGDKKAQDYGYKFDDDPLSAGGFGPGDARIIVRPAAARTTLIRPRTSFVPEMLKSVENI